MIERTLYYQAGFFSPDAYLEATPEIIRRLLEAFDYKDFIPTTVPEIVIGSPQQGLMAVGPFSPKMRINVTTPNQEWTLAFQPDRVSLKKMEVIGGAIGEPEDFQNDAIEMFARLEKAKVFSFSGSRLTYNTRGLLPEMKDEQLTKVNTRILRLPSFYQEHPPCEWATRNVAHFDLKFGPKTECCNVITDINRVQGRSSIDGGEAKLVDRIETRFEINTHQDRQEIRFCHNDISTFLESAIKICNKLSHQSEKVLYG
ncbi:MAG: hypothetical protein IH984_10485 [Planctomycetes bacterium]|nr:hypothetical protein [Planctomycetota bacterium]